MRRISARDSRPAIVNEEEKKKKKEVDKKRAKPTPETSSGLTKNYHHRTI